MGIAGRAFRTWPLAGLVFLVPAWARGVEPPETIREATRASVEGLTSGIGKGVFRHYRASGEGGWKLVQDADLATYFDGHRYHIELAYHRDGFRRNEICRIIYNGDRATCGWFSPRIHPSGARGQIFAPDDHGDGLARPLGADFPWDVSRLPGNVWDFDFPPGKVVPPSIAVERETGGDLVLTIGLIGGERVRADCPQSAGFRIGRLRTFNPGREVPAEDLRVGWKQDPGGLWYIRSMDRTTVLRDERNATWRTRDVFKYTEFEPNAKVEPKMFTIESLRLPAGSRIQDNRVGASVERH